MPPLALMAKEPAPPDTVRGHIANALQALMMPEQFEAERVVYPSHYIGAVRAHLEEALSGVELGEALAEKLRKHAEVQTNFYDAVKVLEPNTLAWVGESRSLMVAAANALVGPEIQRPIRMTFIEYRKPLQSDFAERTSLGPTVDPIPAVGLG